MRLRSGLHVPPYPAAPPGEEVDCLAGVRFADPYRWLEAVTPEVLAWDRAQARLAQEAVRGTSWFDRVRPLVERYNFERNVALPHFAGGRWFRLERHPVAGSMRVLVAETPGDEARLLFDPRGESGDVPPFISWIAPAPNGEVLALGLCTDGSERNRILLLDVASGRPLEGAPQKVLADGWTGGVQWLPDSSGFYFSAPAGPVEAFDLRVYLHRLGSPESLEQPIAWRGAADYRMVQVSRDGRFAVAVERLQNPAPVAWTELHGGRGWIEFADIGDATLAGHIIGDHYVAITDLDAPRGRLVSVPLGDEAATGPSSWRELVAPSNAVLRTVTPVADRLYLTEFVDTYARVRMIDLGGRSLGELTLPGAGAIVSEQSFALMNLVPRGHPDRFLFAFSSLTQSAGVYAHRPGDAAVEEIEPPAEALAARVEDRWVPSQDGTLIPIHIVWPDGDCARARPVLLYAYGGWNVPRTPQFPGPMAAFLAAGGIFVHAHIRGGGELGRDWWEMGRMRNKQNCYDDVHAIAEHLIATGVCTAGALALVGASNGGLMAAVAALQRPELWGAVVPRVPLTDLIGACREPYGRQAVAEELADIEDPAEVRRLANFSPYHLVEEGRAYPPIYLDVGGADPRCPPWHGRKLAARLQQANPAGAPVLLHVWENAGHGAATDRQLAALEHAEWISFVLAATAPAVEAAADRGEAAQ